MIRFALKFLVLFVALSLGFEAVRDGPVGTLLIDAAVLEPAVDLLNAIPAGAPVELVDRTLSSAQVHLHILRGCEGIEMLFVLGAAILAFPATRRRWLTGLATGAVLCWIVSIGRVVALYLTLRHAPGDWEFVHGIIAPLAPIVAAGLYFFVWSGAVVRAPRTAQAEAAA